MPKQKGFSLIVTLLIITMVAIVGYLAYHAIFPIIPNPFTTYPWDETETANNEQIPTLDNQDIDKFESLRGSIEGEINREMNNNYLTGKKFMDFCMSGEWGTFNGDGTISLQWGLDYGGPNDTRPSSGTGRWQIINGELIISDSSISDGTYGDFYFYNYNEQDFAVPKDAYCGMYIGTDLIQIENFYKEFFFNNYY